MANDITFNSGAFSPREDAVFRAVTEFALEERLPLLYLAANSGARVGLANEVKKSLQVCDSGLIVLSLSRQVCSHSLTFQASILTASVVAMMDACRSNG